jgi:benzoate/toluate 1,2-dioxygenase beta subunit
MMATRVESKATRADIGAVERFLIHEARMLDEARYDEWLALFTADAWYWVPSEANQKSPRDTVSLIYDDRRLLETRVRRLMDTIPHAQEPPSRTSRIVANVTFDASSHESHLVRSKLMMVEYRLENQRIFAATCFHQLVTAGDTFRIASKRVDLINSDATFDGLIVPF